MPIRLLILPTIYLSLLLLTVVMCFMKNEWAMEYKRKLININLMLLLLIVVDLSVFNLRGMLLDRLIFVAFLLTSSVIFALYRKTLQSWQKIYYGLFIFYPLLSPLTFFMDRIFCVLAMSPFIVSLILPETRFENQNYELRSPVGIISSPRLQLIKKGIVTETLLGTCNNEDIVSLDISNIKVTSVTVDSTTAVIMTKDQKYQAVFHKRL